MYTMDMPSACGGQTTLESKVLKFLNFIRILATCIYALLMLLVPMVVKRDSDPFEVAFQMAVNDHGNQNQTLSEPPL